MSQSFDELVKIMARLRAPGGCPWDHEQTHESILPQLVEETYEFIQAAQDKNKPHMCEELGDLLLHIVFHAQMASETGDFTAEDVARGICEKLVHRHPHVFGDAKVKDAGEVLQQWDVLKSAETKKHKGNSFLDSVPRALPALLEGAKLGKKAGKTGFDWPDASGVWGKVDEETTELKQAVAQKDAEAIEHEIGDTLLALANLARFLKVDPEAALKKANRRFRDRYAVMEKTLQKENLKPENLTPEKWDELWKAAKLQTA